MRRTQIVMRHPDVEAAQTELSALENTRNTVQHEVLAIAENRKHIEAETRAKVAEMAEQVVAIEKALTAAVTKHERTIKTHEGLEAQAMEATLVALEKKQDAEKESGVVLAALGGLRKELKTLAESVRLLQKQEEYDVDAAQKAGAECIKLEKKLADIRYDITVCKHELSAAREDLAAVTALSRVAKDGCDIALHSRERIQSEVDTLERSLSEIKSSIEAAKEELVAIETKKNETQTAIDAANQALGVRAGNATRLEERIDIKLEQLKQAEQEFTTEHLARMGYKPVA